MRLEDAVMVGIAGGGLDRVLLGWAAEEAAVRHTSLLVCHVRERWEPDRVVEQLGPELQGLKVETRAAHGGPATALLEAAASAAAIVVGARGSGGFGGLVIGSVSQQVLRHAACPVVVAR